MNTYKIAIIAVLIFMLVAFQLSFISALPGYLNNFNLILVVLVFILSLGSLDLALWWAVGAGVLLDIFSFFPFGIFLISLSLSVAIVNLLLTNFFTNRSLYSFFGLTVFFTLFYEFIVNVIFSFLRFINSWTSQPVLKTEFWLNLSAQIVLNLVAALLIFYIINFTSNKLKPAFIVKTKK